MLGQLIGAKGRYLDPKAIFLGIHYLITSILIWNGQEPTYLRKQANFNSFYILILVL